MGGHAGAHSCVCVPVKGRGRWLLDVLLYCSPNSCLRQSLSLSLKLCFTCLLVYSPPCTCPTVTGPATTQFLRVLLPMWPAAPAAPRLCICEKLSGHCCLRTTLCELLVDCNQGEPKGQELHPAEGFVGRCPGSLRLQMTPPVPSEASSLLGPGTPYLGWCPPS